MRRVRGHNFSQCNVAVFQKSGLPGVSITPYYGWWSSCLWGILEMVLFGPLTESGWWPSLKGTQWELIDPSTIDFGSFIPLFGVIVYISFDDRRISQASTVRVPLSHATRWCVEIWRLQANLQTIQSMILPTGPLRRYPQTSLNPHFWKKFLSWHILG